MASIGRLSRLGFAAAVALLGPAQIALAGPPYQADDPQPTDYGHFEIYSFNKGASGRSGSSGASGIDFNYGAAPNLQLTAVLPVGFDSPAGAVTAFGLTNIELAAKYRFLRQDTFGLDVSVFPRIFLPSASSALGDRQPSLLLPIWVQKDWGSVSAFGGGGCQVTLNGPTRSFCMYGATLTRQFLPKLQLGAEVFHQTSDGLGVPASTTLGVGSRYDLSENYHLLGYVARGLQNVDRTSRLSWYAAILFTF